MDWDKVKLTPIDSKDRRANPQTGRLSELDFYKLTVISKLLNKSLAAVLQTAVYTYLGRTWDDHETRLQVEANNRGMSPEEYFILLATGDRPDIAKDSEDA